MEPEPSLLQVTKDLIDQFASEIPSSMPQGWKTSNVLVSLVGNKSQLTDYGPYYNYCIEKSSEGESSLDKQSKTSFSSDGSFEVFFPTVRDLLDYYIDSRLCEVTRDPKLCDSKQPSQLMLLQDIHTDQHIMERALKAKGYNFCKAKNDCLFKSLKYIRYSFESYKIACKAYRLLTGQYSLENKIWFLVRRKNAYIPPSVILRNVPEKVTFEELRDKVREVAKVEILEAVVPPFRLRETYNTIVSLKSIKDCEVLCYFMNRKTVFYKSQITKCCIHPQSQRTPFDTNFTEYLRNGTMHETFSKLIPHWERIHKPPAPRQQSQQGQIRGDPDLQQPKPHARKPSYRRSHS